MKTVLISGASRGLGNLLAREYAKDGYQVFAGARDTACDGIARLQEDFGPQIVPVALDVSSGESVRQAAAQVAAACDGLDLLINNAGIHGSKDEFEGYDVELVPVVFNTNTAGPLRMASACLNLLRARKGTVLNITSDQGSITRMEWHDDLGYRISKAGVNMLTKILSNLLVPEGMLAYCVNPGWINTDMGGPDAVGDAAETAAAIKKLLDSKIARRSPILYSNIDGSEIPW